MSGTEFTFSVLFMVIAFLLDHSQITDDDNCNWLSARAFALNLIILVAMRI